MSESLPSSSSTISPTFSFTLARRTLNVTGISRAIWQMTGSWMRFLGKMRSTACFMAPVPGLNAARDGRDDAHFGVVGHLGLGAFLEADVFAVDENIDEPPHLAGLVADALADAGIIFFEVCQALFDGRALGVHHGLILVEFSERGGNSHFCC